MKRQVFGAVLAATAVTLAVFLSACSLFCDTTDSVFDDGEDAIATDRIAPQIESAEFTYEINDGKGNVLIRYQEPDHVRIDVWDGDRSAVFCLTGSSGWIYVRGDVIDMTAEDIEQMHASLLQTLPFNVNFQSIFGNAELQEETEFACGEECCVIHAVFRRNPKIPAILWFGKKSDLLRQVEITREDGVHTMQYFGYRMFGDVALPMHMFRFSPNGAAKLSLVSFEANTDIPGYVFRKPERLNAMKGNEP